MKNDKVLVLHDLREEIYWIAFPSVVFCSNAIKLLFFKRAITQDKNRLFIIIWSRKGPRENEISQFASEESDVVYLVELDLIIGENLIKKIYLILKID